MANPIPQLPGTQIVDDPWEAAFGAFQQALIDLNGDGVPDAVTSANGQLQTIDNRMRQAMSRRAMAGRDPMMNPQEVVSVADQRRVAGEQNSQALAERGFGEALLGQPVQAIKAIGAAYEDPTLANVTSAGTNSLLAAFRPVKAAGVLTAGMLEALRRDYGASPIGEAEAQTAKGKGQQTANNGYTRPELESISKEVGVSPDVLATMTRRRVQELSVEAGRSKIKTQGTVETEAAANQEAERKRAVLAAESERDRIMKRDRRFSDTEAGKIYDKVGPAVVAGLAGAGAGAVSKLATPSGKVIYDYLLPAGLGAWAGAKAFNAPLEFNAFSTEPDNQRRLAMETYAQMLPEGDPNKARVQAEVARGDYGEKKNKLQELALDEYNRGFYERSLFGAASGLTGGVLGSEFVRAPGRMLEGAAEMPGRIANAYRRGFTGQAKPGAGSSPASGGQAGAGGGSAGGSQQPQLPNPASGQGAAPPSPAYAAYDPSTHGQASRQLLDDLLSQPNIAQSGVLTQPNRLAQLAEARFAGSGLPIVDPAGLATRAQGTVDELAVIDALLRSGNLRRTITAPEVRQPVLNASTGRDYTLALPMAGAAGGGVSANALMNYYRGQEPAY